MVWQAGPARLLAGAILTSAAALAVLRVVAPADAVAAAPPPVTNALHKPLVAMQPPSVGAPFAPPPAAPAKPAAPAPIVINHVIDTGGPLRFGDYFWDASAKPTGPVTIAVDLKAATLSVFRGGYEIGTTAVIYGADAKQTPLGTFPILQKDRHHFSSTYHHAPMPFTLRLTGDGVSIHASEVDARYATHGCIGVPKGFAEKLFGTASVGDRVIVTNRGAAGQNA